MAPMTSHPDDHEAHDHDRGLAFDLATLLPRRRMLQLLGGAGLLALAGCAASSKSSTSATTAAGTTSPAGATTTAAGPTATTAAGSAATTTATTATGSTGSIEEIPEETAGPYPGDGSNGVNVLTRERHRAQ